MKLLILGDIMGALGRKACYIINYQNLIKIIKYEADFVIVNGENASDDGRGITKNIAEEFFKIGVDVITSGNHIWDKKKLQIILIKKIDFCGLLILAEGSPGRGLQIYFSKDKKYKVGVINLNGKCFYEKNRRCF